MANLNVLKYEVRMYSNAGKELFMVNLLLYFVPIGIDKETGGGLAAVPPACYIVKQLTVSKD